MRFDACHAWRTAALLLACPAVAAAQERPAVVVLPFESSGSYGRDRDEYDALRRGIAAMVMSELARSYAARLVERERVQAALEEQGLASSDRIDAATAARLGRALAAHYVVAGNFIDLYGDFRIDARIIDVQSSEIVTVVRSDPRLTDRRQLYRIIQSVADRVAGGAKLAQTGATDAASRGRNVPTDALSLYSRGLLYQDRGDRERAIDFLNRAVAAYPDYTEAREALRRVRGS